MIFDRNDSLNIENAVDFFLYAGCEEETAAENETVYNENEFSANQ